MNDDILGPDWAQQTIALAPDHEGPAVATLVYRRRPARSRRAVVYIHGFVDYFFQTHMAEEFEAKGFDFYALDLRKYGRSLLPHQTPNDARDIREYNEEIDAAMAIVRETHDTLVLVGHSTGGLIASLWSHDRRERGLVDALILNSPWFDLNGTLVERTVGTGLVDWLGGVSPDTPVGKLGEHYGRSLHRQTGGAWDYDLTLKPIEGFPVHAGWARAIRRGQARLKAGLDIACPVLVCASTRSGPDDRWHEDLLRTDSVLDVADIAREAQRLGNVVTLVRIPDGIHDLSLSPEPARSRFFAEIFRWARGYVPDDPGNPGTIGR